MKTNIPRAVMAFATLLLVLLGVLPLSAISAQERRSSTEAAAFSLPSGTAGQAYEYQMQTEGGLHPLTWRLVSGELPPGISLNTSGKLKGTATAPRREAYSFVIEVSDSSQTPQRFEQPFVLVIQAEPLRIVTNTAPLKIVPPTQNTTVSLLSPPVMASGADSSNGGQRSVRVAGERVSNDTAPDPATSSARPRAVRSDRIASVSTDETPVDGPPPPPPVFRAPVEGDRIIIGTASPGAKVKIFVHKIKETVDRIGDLKATSEAANDKGEFEAKLSNPLELKYYVSALQVVGTVDGVPSAPQEVKSTLYDWGRARAYFTADIIFSKERDQFSQQDLGLSFNLDYNWIWGRTHNFNTYFDASLTAIPVKAQDGTPPATPPPTTTDVFLASKKAAILQGGAYLPISRESSIWRFNGDENAFFIAPIAKGGIQTITDAQQTNEAKIFGGDDVFHFFSAGVRIGHFKLSDSKGVAHELISYLDITTGKWENFEVVRTNGDRESQRRWGFEGRLKIPATPLLVGFDANLGKGKDDLRFIFGTRFDIGRIFGKLKSFQ